MVKYRFIDSSTMIRLEDLWAYVEILPVDNSHIEVLNDLDFTMRLNKLLSMIIKI